MKKLSAIIIAMALVLAMSQCKKQETPATNDTNDGMVYITVNVDNNNDGRHHIEPSVGAYVFTYGDVLFVGDGSHFIGTLEYNGVAFEGTIYEPSSDYLYFYFSGGKLPETSIYMGETESFTVSIADQSSNLPILAYGRSAQQYNGPGGPYSTTLRNKCALVKFNLNIETSDEVTVRGMLTEATINFRLNENSDNAIVAGNATGTITMYDPTDGENKNERWVILLPGTSFDGDDNVIVEDYVPSISNNGYITSGLSINNPPADYVFSINETQTVYFAPGNLQYNHGLWRFAEHQYDICQTSNGDWNTSSWVDFFGWGTWSGSSGWNPTNASSDDDTYQWYGDKYFQGALTNNDKTGWFTLSNDEWRYILNHNTMGWSTVNGISGYVIRPDGKTQPIESSYTADAWAIEETKGSVFLPAAGNRTAYNTPEVYNVGSYGNYWSSTPIDTFAARSVYFESNHSEMLMNYRSDGYSVRLVRYTN